MAPRTIVHSDGELCFMKEIDRTVRGAEQWVGSSGGPTQHIAPCRYRILLPALLLLLMLLVTSFFRFGG